MPDGWLRRDFTETTPVAVEPGLPVGVRAVKHTKDCHRSTLVINSVDDAISAPARAVPVLEWCPQSFANAMRIFQQWTCDELISRKGHRFGGFLS
jgi:hypothetical protein